MSWNISACTARKFWRVMRSRCTESSFGARLLSTCVLSAWPRISHQPRRGLISWSFISGRSRNAACSRKGGGFFRVIFHMWKEPSPIFCYRQKRSKSYLKKCQGKREARRKKLNNKLMISKGLSHMVCYPSRGQWIIKKFRTASRAIGWRYSYAAA